MSATEEKAAFAIEIAEAVVRRWWTIVAGLCVGTAAALLALHHLPKVYESSTKVLVTRPQISESLVPTTVVDDMKRRMATLREAVLSRPYLEKIIDEYYPPKPAGEQLERMVESIRYKVNVDVRRGYFAVTYRDKDPVRAANVANALAQFYIEENAAFRIGRAGDTTETLEQLADNALVKLNEKEQAISEFKAKYPHETGTETFEVIRIRELKQRDLDVRETELRAERQALESLRSKLERAETAPQLQLGDGADDADPDLVRLATLKRELADLKGAYTDTHPAVRAKQREIETLSLQLSDGGPLGEDGTPTVSPTVLRLEDRVAEANTRIKRLESDAARLRGELVRYDRLIERAPRIRQELSELTKGYTQLKARYDDYQAKVESARGSEMIEEGRKSAQFEIMESALPSSIPVKPVPLFLLGANLAWALVLFVGPVLLKRLIKPTIGSQKSVKAMSDVPLLVTIPPIETPEVKGARRRLKLANFAFTGIALSIVVGVALYINQ